MPLMKRVKGKKLLSGFKLVPKDSVVFTKEEFSKIKELLDKMSKNIDKTLERHKDISKKHNF